ncbi:TolC family outer membrane protein [Pacificimonas flava]|uniref:Type I secretion outer membrane protein, TolC n=1 Tax=Pacificimonas flava TaxID=1234595 RepID=M2TK19_9SPHN|nr:TolC family outer membrane protein [Pacificimonas flava]EMD82016.1 Type I secretion outer membrane protein, TolC precursor [Pacificimonas flava]MBB5280421.1 outer membrane protein [Pacificimonas flava]
MRYFCSRIAIAGGLAATAAISPASAETLQDAFASAYSSNPDLTSARAGQRITDETLIQARSATRPTVSGQGVIDQQTSNPGRFDDQSRLVNVGIELRQPVYRGGQIRNDLKAADRGVLAGREQMRGTENQVMLDTVTVYMDVLRDQSEVELTENNVRVLERQLQASQDRFEVGDVTRTDVAQSEARLALARSQNIAALANLEASKNAYARVVGHAPDDLQPPPPLPPLPDSPEEAVDTALEQNPFIISARLQEDAQRYRAKSARAARLPSVDATFAVGYTNFRGVVAGGGGLRAGGVDFTQNIGATVTVPLYQRGQVGSQIRSQMARADQLREDALNAERQVIERVRTAFENLRAARATIQASSIAVDSNTLALEGTRAELTVGTRNILDVLNAEQELLNAQVQLVRAERNSYVAGFALLAALGRAEASDLSVPVELYNSEEYLDRADDHWFDWDAEFEAQPLRTDVKVPARPDIVQPPIPDPTPAPPSVDEIAEG